MHCRLLFTILALVCTDLVCVSQRTVKGYVVTLNGDTLRGEIAKAPKEREERRLAFTEVTIINDGGQSTRYVPGEIRAYAKGPVIFRNFADGDKHVFAQQLASGKVWLFFDGVGSRYFFKRDKEKEFMVMNANYQLPRGLGAHVPQHQTNANGTDIPIIADRDQAFREYFSNYFKDCLRISRKITMQFYSRSDIKDIFVDYNAECK